MGDNLERLQEQKKRFLDELGELSDDSAAPPNTVSPPISLHNTSQESIPDTPSPKRICLSPQRLEGGTENGIEKPELVYSIPSRCPVAHVKQEDEINGNGHGETENGIGRPAVEEAVQDHGIGVRPDEENPALEVKKEDDDSDFSDVDDLLEAPINAAKAENPPTKAPYYKEKVVLKHRSTEYFEVLPEGWIEVTHRSGMPVYLHKTSRVCTFSRPYFLGPGSVRNHAVPIAAIPCLHQARVREVEAEQAATNSNEALAKLGAPLVSVQTADDFRRRNLDFEALRDYASARFQFETIKVLRFGSWSANRSFNRRKRIARDEAKLEEQLGRPSLPSHVKLITVPSLDHHSKPQHKPFFINPLGKTSIAVLHEFVQKILKGNVQYDFHETRNAAHPYSATVKLSAGQKAKEAMSQILARLPASAQGPRDQDDPWVPMGTGYGNSKKTAKLDAATKALELLMPGDLHFNEQELVRIRRIRANMGREMLVEVAEDAMSELREGVDRLRYRADAVKSLVLGTVETAKSSGTEATNMVEKLRGALLDLGPLDEARVSGRNTLDRVIWGGIGLTLALAAEGIARVLGSVLLSWWLTPGMASMAVYAILPFSFVAWHQSSQPTNRERHIAFALLCVLSGLSQGLVYREYQFATAYPDALLTAITILLVSRFAGPSLAKNDRVPYLGAIVGIRVVLLLGIDYVSENGGAASFVYLFLSTPILLALLQIVFWQVGNSSETFFNSPKLIDGLLPAINLVAHLGLCALVRAFFAGKTE